ncbi:Nucleotidyltransferase substrate binding like protein [Candidatus Trichorickettsia mobilis]|uniref:Nucleotidyltransferase substrate binding like protein n=1 Tax=Candidatus Trichorickettsia mobilis TaxID=1346319 RepID=A0ABZ0UTP2_9RICK|nr:HI0074 family nucleotidyltransferase substrate-binding subunit [Candidatus Trichorickettsia mobilis]WPY01397.1 Nucleotidyltransferase substrate binding like protein [Candidatus Trichorickettsia mobilis]
MSEPKIKLAFVKLQKALYALEIIAKKPLDEDRRNIDATIQRFEFTIELFWKLLKSILESKGVEVQYPKDVLREAYKGYLIDHEEQWLQMLKDRNLTSHTYDYDENLADIIYQRILTYVPVFKETYVKLADKFNDETIDRS